jgi:PEP-CTERM motif
LNLMKKSFAIYFLAAAVLCLVSGFSAKADTITLSWGEQNGTGTLPFTIDAGTLAFTVPTGQSIVGAVFSSTLGNSTIPNTAVMNVFVNGVLVGACLPGDPVCATSAVPTPFSYTYTTADLLSLATGLADLTITQTDCCVIRLGDSTLVITTAPTAAPEPGSLALLGLGVFGLAALKLSKR